MRIINPSLLESFRMKRVCEWCGRANRGSHMEAHHLFCKGMGGGSRLDVAINLCALCRECHQSSHDGNEPTKIDLLAIVAQRESRQQDEMEREIFRLIRADQNGKEPRRP